MAPCEHKEISDKTGLCKKCAKPLEPRVYLLSWEKLEELMDEVIYAAYDAVHWGEGIDIPVLRIRINRIVAESEVKDG